MLRPLPLRLPAAAAGGASPRPSPRLAPRGRPGPLRGKGPRPEMREAVGWRTRALGRGSQSSACRREGRTGLGGALGEASGAPGGVPPPGSRRPDNQPCWTDCSSCRAGGLHVHVAVEGRAPGTLNLRIWGCSGVPLGWMKAVHPAVAFRVTHWPPWAPPHALPKHRELGTLGEGSAHPGPMVSSGALIGIGSRLDWMSSLPPA